MKNSILMIFILLFTPLIALISLRAKTKDNFCQENKCLWSEDLGRDKLHCIIVEDERIDILRFIDDVPVKGNFPDYYVGNDIDGYNKITEEEAHNLRLTVKR